MNLIFVTFKLYQKLRAFCFQSSVKADVNCTHEKFGIVTVHPTFNLGEFHVIPVVFLQKKFVKKYTNQQPIGLGPLLIH